MKWHKSAFTGRNIGAMFNQVVKVKTTYSNLLPFKEKPRTPMPGIYSSNIRYLQIALLFLQGALHHQSVDLEGQTRCEPCDLGEAVNYTGALRCYKCPPGAAGQPLVSNQRGEGRENTNFEHVYVYTAYTISWLSKKETYIAHDRRSTVLFYICFL